jgi:DNA-binding MurR/RpiR family transcriptional regulator
MSKLYQSKVWLSRQFIVKKKKPKQIAAEQGVSEMTIYRYLRQFGLIK